MLAHDVGPEKGPGALHGTALALAASALLEVPLYRVLRPLAEAESLVLPTWAQKGLLALSVYSLNLVWVLGLVVCGLALLERSRFAPAPLPDGRQLQGKDLPGRVALALIGGFYLSHVVLLTIWPLWARALGIPPSRGGILLQGAAACLALLLFMSTLPQRLGVRFSLGLLLLTTPVQVHFYAYWSLVRGQSQEGRFLDILGAGQWISLIAFLLSPLLLLPAKPKKILTPGTLRAAAILASVITLSLVALLLLDWSTAAQLTNRIAGMRLPLWPLGQAVLVLSVFGVAFSGLTLTFQYGEGITQERLRLRGAGLVCIALSGYQLAENVWLTLFLAGLFLIVRSAALGFEERRLEPGRGTPTGEGVLQ